MKNLFKKILPVLLVLLILASIVWYCFIYDRAFTRDMLARVLSQKVDTGLFSEELALEVAQDLCWRNAQTLYGR